jgi:hypothetical protein
MLIKNKLSLIVLTLISLVLAAVSVTVAQVATGVYPVYKNGELYLQNTGSTQVNALTATPAGGKVSWTLPPNSTVPTGIPTSQPVRIYACYAPTYPIDSDSGYSAGWDSVHWTCR